MSTHDVAEAEQNLSDLIDQALKGEAVVITRDGRPVAEIKPVAESQPVKRPPGKRMTAAERLAWLETNRVELSGGPIDVQAILRQIRDEG
jgi:prevent-host-death family protein